MPPSILLTADRTLMANYTVLLDGIMGTVQTSLLPAPAWSFFLAPPVPTQNGNALKAPLGLRRLEAGLLEAGFARETVQVVTPENLLEQIGPETTALCVSSGDPLGLGMSNTTLVEMAGGELLTKRFFRMLMERIKERRKKFPNFKLLVGGPGAWQFDLLPSAQEQFQIDTLISGYAERLLPQLLRDLEEGKPLPKKIQATCQPGQTIPPIQGASVMGVLEISRGCGWGCDFCGLGKEPMIHLPESTILADAETNLNAGVHSLCAISEDFLRYGAVGSEINPERVLALFQKLRALKGLELLQLDHVNVSSILRFPEEALKELHHQVVGDKRHECLWVNVGVESASGQLLWENGLKAKLGGHPAESWGEVSEEAIRRLIRAGFFPMISLVLGLPGERPEDLEKTLSWIERFSGERVVIFPLFFAAITPEQKSFALAQMTPLHWKLFRRAYDFNFRWMPRMFRDNQRAGGVAFWRRWLLQMGGQAQRLYWQMRFAWLSGKMFR